MHPLTTTEARNVIGGLMRQFTKVAPAATRVEDGSVKMTRYVHTELRRTVREMFEKKEDPRDIMIYVSQRLLDGLMHENW